MSDVFTKGPYRRDRTRVADQVSEDLRGQILSGRLQRGSKLPSEKELAAQYDVSSPTIREALGALSAMSLIEVRHGSGTYVSAETDKLLSSAMAAIVQLESVDILSIMDISEALHLKAVRLAPSKATKEDLSTLRRAVDALNAAATAGTDHPDELLAAFLKALVATSHNPLLTGLSGFLIDAQIALVRDVAKRAPSSWRMIAGDLVEEREAIVAALEARDGDAAQAAVLTYMQHGEELVRLNLEKVS
ncbi:FadR/GntR family transcriptional regulator [Pseudarthrobacter raffinosi]|uniref:FadR/GntR family transcriptional regulator n=1 Tax=Pseudarthrobacter raffinosi TaxID=2953651 RepID=UPI00208FB5F8|nr:GntR family transcriptional regulator [Pseudarthrobacter sp. MDT3-9]MCO4252118.1 GntR family transcriptional regulator [Pseudarthrobacter sp. MDT3-9]